MVLGDVLGIGVVVIAYALTWVLLLRSLKIVNIIDREKLKHASQIRTRLRAEDATPEREE